MGEQVARHGLITRRGDVVLHTKKNGSALQHTTKTSRVLRTGFTMMDLMVSLVIVTVLIALMLPAISLVRESTHRVICASNLRQIGMGISLYSQDTRDHLPDSVFLPPAPSSNGSYIGAYDRMDTVLLPSDEFTELSGDDRWDGLGLLYHREYIAAPNLYYCPSHQGSFTYDDAADDWINNEAADEIVVNYLYRGRGPLGSRVLYNIPSRAALVTDTLRSFYDLNHQGGFNVMQAGLAVDWYDDIGDQIANNILLRSGDDNDASTTVQDAWGRLDEIPNLVGD